MGNGYFRTSQTSTTRAQQRDKRNQRAGNSYQHNYVDRVRLEDTNGNGIYQPIQQGKHDPRCPQLRAAGWRHNHKSVSHLDLATSCHDAAVAGLDHKQHQQQEHYPQSQHIELLQQSSLLHAHSQPHWTQCRVSGQLRNARSLDYTQLEREENALDIAEFYWRFDANAEVPLEVNDLKPTQQTTTATTTTTTTPAQPTSTNTAAATFFDFGRESCSLRRSRSLAIIREETFSDLQIGSANSSRRRSQLIPRARLVNRGFFRESSPQQQRLLNGKQQQTTTAATATPINAAAVACDDRAADDSHSHTSAANTCDSHLQQQQQLQQQQHHHCYHQRHHYPQQHQLKSPRESRDFDLYYDNLKRLDALALGLSEQLHPWHNDKSDLESLNSDYFKNSLHQSHEQQQQQQQQPSSLEFDALEQAVTLLSERPRIYQSRRQQLHHSRQHYVDKANHSGADSCPEHSQSSLFPETTTSNSDDQTDSPSLSEQEYDLTHIEQIFQQTQLQGNDTAEESYELISLTTTTRTCFETSEDNDEGEEPEEQQQLREVNIQLLATSQPTTDSETNTESTLKRTHSEQLDKLIAYDSVYLSSEDSSDCTLIGESCESFEQRTFTSCLESGELETRSLLHISIEDTVYEPQAKQHKKEASDDKECNIELIVEPKDAQIYTQVLRVEHTPVSQTSTTINVGVTSSVASKPKILSVVEKRKLKRYTEPSCPAALLEEYAGSQPILPQLKRQATDTLVIKQKSNLTENQYHSLPDVNIGQSLKVSECIDAELRSSYNLQKHQRKEAAAAAKQTKRQRAENEQVTREEIYDSIRRFGRAHQKARQREYQERQQQRVVAKSETETKHKTDVQEERRINSTEATTSSVLSTIKVKETPAETAKQEVQPTGCKLTPVVADASDIADLSSNENLPPSVSEVTNFSRLIEQRAQEIRAQKTTTIQPQFQIIVTDAQNNIIEQDAIKETQQPVKAAAISTVVTTTAAAAPVATEQQLAFESPVIVNGRSGGAHATRSSSVKRIGSRTAVQDRHRRVSSSSTPIYKARPIKVLTSGDSFRRSACGKMSRPQILHVVDSSSSAGSGSSNGIGATLRRRSSAGSKNTANDFISNVSQKTAVSQAENEYLQKVDAVRCYWSRLASDAVDVDTADKATQSETPTSRHFRLGPSSETTAATSPAVNDSTGEYCSYMPPSIEIVELGDGDGAQKAAIVSAHVGHSNAKTFNDNNTATAAADDDDDDDEDAAEFHHIRYKVLKSQQLIRSNILTARNKKEAQFDGLIQYLQEYSFQELLSNNNVVIVEPVRTKIEKPLTVGGNLTGTTTATSAVSGTVKPNEINLGGSLATGQQRRQRQRQGGNNNGGGLKRHFFYQPVRVNRELYEDELPDPDTVRNVRRFFEQRILPTPGQGLLVQSQQFGGSACQLSPKTRRARKYRYLTIDTSYGSAGIEQPKGMELLEEHKHRHWDNASLSSGISSGDLSSPCGECQQEAVAAKESPVLACKDVHVQDVVRRHNSNAANAKARAKASRRTWCAGANDSRYRQIYEHNLGQQQRALNGHGNAALYTVAADDDVDVDDADGPENDDNNDDNDDVEQDMCESYYVSNDILAKIRECGSTVTYYGGRVLEHADNNMPQQMPLPAGGMGTATRTRVRQIEACNVCLPSQQCDHRLQMAQRNGRSTVESEPQHDSYQGIKFKLVKSNSCSSRLELAGAIDVPPTDTEVVRKMVHHFEANQPVAATGNDDVSNLTINNQKATQGQEPGRHVTVNNHINVVTKATAQLSKCENLNGQQQELQPAGGDDDKEAELTAQYCTAIPTTYHSQAMNIRLGRLSSKHNASQQSKICRNKNVDLAYTMAKQQPPAIAGKIIGTPSTPNGNQWPQVNKMEKEYIEIDRQSGEQSERRQTAQSNALKQAEMPVCRPQIIVPVEIHQQQQQQQQPKERRLSNASSSASLVDKSVVRHYVANDKSLFEKRKYDDIEFEEFEIYDPTKDVEKSEHAAPESEPRQADKLRQADAELYDSLDDKL